MNKEEIFKKLDLCGLNKNEIICLSGASLVVQNIIDETNDIDLACSKIYYNKINWPIKKGAFGIEIKYNDVFEISYNLYKPERIEIINGYKFVNLEQCFEVKKMLNREKDKEIIRKLENIISSRKNTNLIKKEGYSFLK